MGIGSLRQGAQKVTQNTSKGGKGGKGGHFNKLRIPKLTPALQGMLRPNENPGDPIMLVRANPPYDDLYNVDEQGNWTGAKGDALHVMTHQGHIVRDGKERNVDITCTAGPNPHAPQPCVGCQQNDAGNKAIGNARQQWAFNVKHLVAYHEIPLLDKKSNTIVMKKEKPTEPVMVLEVCRNSTPSERLYAQQNRLNCEPCNRGIPVIYGAPKALVLGKNHLEELLKVDDHLEQTCANCMTRLIKTAFVCQHCGNDMLDLSRTQMVNDQIKQFAATPQQCPHCRTADLPKPAYDCGFDPNGMYKVPNGCPENVEPRPLSIFDCVFYVHKEGEGTQSRLVISPPIPIHHFRTPTGNADLLQWLTQPHLARTFNLQDMFKAQTLDEQAKVLQVQNPYAAQTQQYQQYPGQQQQQPQGYMNNGPVPMQPGASNMQPPQFQQPVQPQQYGVPQPGYPPQQPQQQPMPGVPFGGRPNFGK